MPGALEEIQIGGNKYVVNPTHRDGRNTKSQWTIDAPSEMQSFELSCNNQWLYENEGWGCHLSGDSLHYLGHSAGESDRHLFIAKYVASELGVWHGYPADHQRKGSTEIPPECLLGAWVNSNYLSAAKVRKLLRGQPCAL